MRLGLIGAGVLLAGGLTLGAAGAYVDSKAGPGTARESLRFGVQQTAGMAGEAANVLPETVNAVKPAISGLAGQAGGLLGTTATTTPNWDQPVDPATQAPRQ